MEELPELRRLAESHAAVQRADVADSADVNLQQNTLGGAFPQPEPHSQFRAPGLRDCCAVLESGGVDFRERNSQKNHVANNGKCSPALLVGRDGEQNMRFAGMYDQRYIVESLHLNRGSWHQCVIPKRTYGTKQNIMTRKVVLSIAFLVLSVIAGTAQNGRTLDPTACLTADENFAFAYDILAIVFAILATIVLPLLLPMVFRSSWWWHAPTRRWIWVAVGTCILFLLVVWLPPHLARTQLIGPTSGLFLYRQFAGVPVDYVSCDPNSFPDKAGLLLGHIHPGNDLTLAYAIPQALVFLGLVLVLSAAHWLLVQPLIRTWRGIGGVR